jgi:hypothetical protein
VIFRPSTAAASVVHKRAGNAGNAHSRAWGLQSLGQSADGRKKVSFFLSIFIMILQAHTHSALRPFLPTRRCSRSGPLLLSFSGAPATPSINSAPEALLSPSAALWSPTASFPPSSLDVLRRPGSPTRPFLRSGLGFPWSQGGRGGATL